MMHVRMYVCTYVHVCGIHTFVFFFTLCCEAQNSVKFSVYLLYVCTYVCTYVCMFAVPLHVTVNTLAHHF